MHKDTGRFIMPHAQQWETEATAMSDNKGTSVPRHITLQLKMV